MRTIGFSNYAVRPIGTYSNSNIGYIGSMNNKPIKNQHLKNYLNIYNEK